MVFKMNELVMHDFIDQLVKGDINNESFVRYIDMFSKYLNYTNSSYKYNGTYLNQYVNEFIDIIQWLKNKVEIYKKILIEIGCLGSDYILLIDQVYYAHSFTKVDEEGITSKEIDIQYVKIDKEKIMNKKIEVKTIIIREEEEYLIYKEYADYQDENLTKNICKDIKGHIVLKEGEEIDI